MNEKTQAIYDGMRKIIEVATPQAERLDEQIKALTNFRDSLLGIANTARMAMDTIEKNKWTFLGLPEVMTPPGTPPGTPRQPTPDVPNQYPLESGIPLPPAPEAQWEIIARTMKGRESFTMTEAGEALEAGLGRKIGKNRPQTVRNNLVRHTERFRQNPDSTWTVLPEDGETATQEATA